MKYFIAILILIVPTFARAVQTCDRGYYKPSADSECTWCMQGYYCPDDDTDDAIACPVDNTDWNKLLSECGYHPLQKKQTTELFTWTWTDSGDPLAPYKITHCYAVNLKIELQEGLLHLETIYDTQNETYWHGCDILKYFYAANSGYYLSHYNYTTFKNWYNYIKPCTNEHPTHSHYSGPGTPDDPVKGGKTDYNDCPWACDDGYVLREGECLPLCTAGATKFHVGDSVFNIYADKLTTLAINIALGNGTVCYVPLVNGSGKGLNVDYHGTVYHTSD